MFSTVTYIFEWSVRCSLLRAMDIKRILVAVDSLNGRDAAFERAASLARSSGAELYLLYAVPVSQPFSFGAAARLERMADLRKRAEDVSVGVRTVEQQGDPADLIELHANARAVDLIVMGGVARRGWSRRRSLVAERVIRRTDIPTLVVPSDAPETLTSFRNLLVAVDLSPSSEDVLSAALGLTAADGGQLTVMHTVKSFDRTHIVEDARRHLEAVLSTVPATFDARAHVLTGSAARTILEHAADVNADLVVVGRSRGFKMLGSTALRVLRKNDRALLVIPTAAHRADRVEPQLAA